MYCTLSPSISGLLLRPPQRHPKWKKTLRPTHRCLSRKKIFLTETLLPKWKKNLRPTHRCLESKEDLLHKNSSSSWMQNFTAAIREPRLLIVHLFTIYHHVKLVAPPQELYTIRSSMTQASINAEITDQTLIDALFAATSVLKISSFLNKD